jgi:hypothetical protein
MKMPKIPTSTLLLFASSFTRHSPCNVGGRTIFIFGNSYTYFNGGIESMVKARSFEYNRRGQSSTGNGAKLPRHLLNLDGTNAVTRRRGKH